MKKYIIGRLIQLIPVLLGITLLSFSLMHSVAGDSIDVMETSRGIVISDEVKAQMRADLGLDKPLIVQYGIWLSNILTGDMGISYVSGKSVFDTFMQKLPATLMLAFISMILTVIISIPLGIYAAVKQNKFTDYLIRSLSFVGNSLPGFFVALLLIYLFSVKLNLFPVIETSSSLTITSIILPALTLTIAMSAKYIRQLRAIVLDELSKDYVLAAKARGIKFSVILRNSVLKVCLIPLITLMSLSLGSLLGGTAIVESIFLWDGVGKMAVDAITMRDYPIILAYVVWMAIIYVCVNLIADIAYHYLDPRIRLGLKSGGDSK